MAQMLPTPCPPVRTSPFDRIRTIMALRVSAGMGLLTLTRIRDLLNGLTVRYSITPPFQFCAHSDAREGIQPPLIYRTQPWTVGGPTLQWTFSL